MRDVEVVRLRARRRDVVAEASRGRLRGRRDGVVVVAHTDDLGDVALDARRSCRPRSARTAPCAPRARRAGRSGRGRASRRRGRPRRRARTTRGARRPGDEAVRDARSSTTLRSGSTMSPPLKAAIGDSRASGSTSIDIPRGGRPLVTANRIPAAWSSWTAAIERSLSDLSDRTSVPSTSESTRRITSSPGSGGSARSSRSRARARARPRSSSSGMIRCASALPSSTPHWSNESMLPDRPLREDAVLVEGDERAERERRQLLGEEHVRRPVALEDAVRARPPRPCPRPAPRPRSCRTRAPRPARTRST